MADYKTSRDDEGSFVNANGSDPVGQARALHHLASADPERDGTLTGPAHEKLYGLEREEDSAALWRAVGVHPYENRALVGDEDGAENLRGIETAAVSDVSEKAVAPRAQK
jgi:hypothetical protein